MGRTKEEIQEEFTTQYEGDSQLETFRTNAQVDIYFLLAAFLADARDSIAIMRSVRDQLVDSLPYASPAEMAKSVTSLAKSIGESVDALLKIIGTPDSPSQLATALLQKRDTTKHAVALEALNPIGREKIRQVFSTLFAELQEPKGAITAEIVPTKLPKKKKKHKKKIKIRESAHSDG